MSTPAQRRANRRKTLPGFPWDGSFATTEDAAKYVAGDRIRCLICGQLKRSLGYHINAIHGITETEYKQRFSIPYGVGLVCSETAGLHGDAVRRSDHYRNLPALAEKARTKIPGSEYRPNVASISRQRAERINGVNENATGPKICDCGAEYIGNQHIKSSCPECRRKRVAFTAEQRQRVQEWTESNKERAAEYQKAKAWWAWKGNPRPLLEYANKWGARLRIAEKLQQAEAK